MLLGNYLRAILRYWWLVVALGLIGAVVGLSVALAAPNMYRATSSVLVASDRGDSTSELVQGSTYAENLVDTYVVLVSSEIVLQPVIDELGLETSVASLSKSIAADSPLNTVIIEIHAERSDPAMAQQIADSVSKSLIHVVTAEVAPTAQDGAATISLTTIQHAEFPISPFAPSKSKNTVLGGLAGVILGIGLAVGRSLLRQLVRSPNDVSLATTVPVVGEVVGSGKGMTLPAALLTYPQGNQAESLRSVAANLNFLTVGEPLRSLVVTSASPGESKTSVVASLGLAVAETQRVLLIDADLRRPSLGQMAQLESAVGLTDVLLGDLTLEEAVMPWSKVGLYLLPSGALPPNPAQMLASSAMHDLISRARTQYDLVIVDSAPALAVTDAKWLGHMTDGSLIVARYGQTSTRALRRVVDAMEGATVPVLGVIITAMPSSTRTQYGEARGDYSETLLRPL